jgi:hypothetical protein
VQATASNHEAPLAQREVSIVVSRGSKVQSARKRDESMRNESLDFESLLAVLSSFRKLGTD